MPIKEEGLRFWDRLVEGQSLLASEREQFSQYRQRAEEAAFCYQFMITTCSRARRVCASEDYSKSLRTSNISRRSPVRANWSFEPHVLIDDSTESETTSDAVNESPINLLPHRAVYDPDLAPIEVHYGVHVNFELINIGYTLLLNMRPRKIPGAIDVTQTVFRSAGDINDQGFSYVRGGPVPDCDFVLVEVWLHWGKENCRGSDHCVNYKAYPVEVQLLHFNSSKYSSFEEAKRHPDGILACAIFAQLGSENVVFAPIVSSLDEVRFMMRSKVINEPHWLNPQYFLPQEDLRDFWTYSGSLTCVSDAPQVNWVVFRYPIHISIKQLDALRGVCSYARGDLPTLPEDQMLMGDNFRPLQRLGDRTVRSSFA